MNVVIRGLMATGLFVYAAIHLLQGLSPPASSPGWLRWAFLATAVAAIALGVGLLALPPGRTDGLKDLAALLAAGSAVALVLAFTTGLLGVTETDIRVDTLAVGIAELVVLVSWFVNRALGHDYDEVSEPVTDGAHRRAQAQS